MSYYLTREDMKNIEDSLANISKKMIVVVLLFYILFIYYFIKQYQV